MDQSPHLTATTAPPDAALAPPTTPDQPAVPNGSAPQPQSLDSHASQAPATTATATPSASPHSPVSSTITQGTSISNSVPVVVPPSPSPATPPTSASSPSAITPSAPVQGSPSSSQLSRKKTFTSKLWALKGPLWALIIVALLDGLALSAPSSSSPLGSISFSNGVIVLSILAMLTGYALATAAQTAWERFRIKKFSSSGGSGQSLLVFWALSSQIGGSCLILWNEILETYRRKTTTTNGNVALQSAATGSPKFWSFCRIISWAVVQLPGAIIMSIVNPETSYIPIQWTLISGGMGLYDRSLAFPNSEPLLITDAVLNILQDARRAVKVPPFSSDCIRAGNSCKSYLLPGGLDLVEPWPYQKLNETNLDVYISKGGPAYQIDFWNPPEHVSVAKNSCSIYAASEDTGFQLCTSSYGGKSGQIVAGWTPCTKTVLPSGECSQDGSWGAYIFFSTILSISRRTATVSMSRDSGTILAWEDLGEPKLQNITASDFKTAFDVMVIPWTNSSPETLSTSSTWQLTAQIATSLVENLAAPDNSRSLDYLRNFFATPLFIFNPVRLGVTQNINITEPDLLSENYFNGSYATTRVHAVPKRWTVLTYVGISGLLLVIIFITLVISWQNQLSEPSELPFVDSLKLKWVLLVEGEREVDDLRQAFQGVTLEDDGRILEQATKIVVRPKTPVGATTNYD